MLSLFVVPYLVPQAAAMYLRENFYQTSTRPPQQVGAWCL